MGTDFYVIWPPASQERHSEPLCGSWCNLGVSRLEHDRAGRIQWDLLEGSMQLLTLKQQEKWRTRVYLQFSLALKAS